LSKTGEGRETLEARILAGELREAADAWRRWAGIITMDGVEATSLILHCSRDLRSRLRCGDGFEFLNVEYTFSVDVECCNEVRVSNEV
jgi:hypothetical protein